MMMAYSLITVALPFRFQALGLSVLQYGTVLAVYALGMLVTESLWGVAAFRIGRASVLSGLGALVAVVVVAIGLAQSFLAFAATLGLLGMFAIFPIPLGRWLAVTARGPGTGGSGSGRYGLFFGLGLVAGTSTGPLVYVEFGFLSLAIASAAIFLTASLLLASIRWREVGLPPRDRGTLAQVRDLLHRHFLLCSALVVFYFLAYTLTINFLQYYSVSLFGGTPTDAGYVIGASRGVGVVAGLLLGPTVDRWGPERTSPLGFLLLAAGALGTFFAVGYGSMVAATLLFSVGTGWLSASILPLALGPVPRSVQGTAVGVFGSFEDLGLLIGPILIGSVYSAYGAHSVFPVVAGLALGGCAFALVLPRWTGRPTGPLAPTLPEHV
jgi:predicted MFS family arabinose efflux permease